MGIWSKASILFFLLIKLGLAADTKISLKEGEITPMPYATPRMQPADCGKIDLSPQMGPVKNQLGESCYAYAAVELVSFGQNKQYSALHLALTHENASGGQSNPSAPLNAINGLNLGNIVEALENGLSRGFCPDTTIPSNQSINPAVYESIVRYYWEADAENCRQVPLNQLENVVGVSGEVKRKLEVWKALKDAVKAAYPTFDLTKLEYIYRTTTIDKFFSSIADEACRGKLVKIRGKKALDLNILSFGQDGKWYFSANKRPALISHVNETLAKGRPVGITFEASGLINRPPSGGVHASVVAGRIWRKEAPTGCHYLVKNSWGPDWKVPAGLKAMSVANHPGYFLISEKSFLEHVHGTTSFE